MSRFVISDLPLAGLKRVQGQRLGDARGFLSRIFCADELADAGWRKPIAQINHAYTARRGTVRGMHFQVPPHAELKLVTCLRGLVFDVAVDLRRDSATFGCWHAEELSAEACSAMLLPEGFAHGFQAMSDDVELLYCHSAPYVSGAEGGVNPLDAGLGIRWPLEVAQISSRDESLPGLRSMAWGIGP